jgi:hypothetical protein
MLCNGSRPFRRRLAARVLYLAGTASLTVASADCDRAAKGTGGPTSASSSTGTHASMAGGTGGTGGDNGGTSGTGGTVGTSGTGGDTGGTSGIGGAGGAGGAGGVHGPVADACINLLDGGEEADGGAAASADAGGCPTDPSVIITDFETLGCPQGWLPYQILSGPTSNGAGQCCYLSYLQLCGSAAGRPYLVGGEAHVAPLARGPGAEGWSRAVADAPFVDDLTAKERASLAAAWTADALLEHASVGAPADLVALAHLAARDEIRHAQLCFGLASTYAGEAVAPGPFPLSPSGAVPVPTTLAELAASTFLEGCIGETVAAAVAAEQRARAEVPAVRAALAQIAADEAHHAELAWKTVAWAVRTGGDEVRAAVEEALLLARCPVSSPWHPPPPPPPPALHGAARCGARAPWPARRGDPGERRAGRDGRHHSSRRAGAAPHTRGLRAHGGDGAAPRRRYQLSAARTSAVEPAGHEPEPPGWVPEAQPRYVVIPSAFSQARSMEKWFIGVDVTVPAVM